MVRSGQIYALDIHPAGNEPMLSPKYNLVRSVYRMPHPEDRTPPACYEYESAFYANYTASPDAEVLIHAELTGANSWWVYGWSGNEYMDRVGMMLTGARDWVVCRVRESYRGRG